MDIGAQMCYANYNNASIRCTKWKNKYLALQFSQESDTINFSTDRL